jgi:arylsulfatase A-like enzyme
MKREQVLPGVRAPEFVPTNAPRPSRPRNLIFVLTESVRADTHCSAYDPRCEVSPVSNAAVPNRMPLLSMRSNDSTTAVSVAVLTTGVAPNSTREEMHSAPMIWELARAAGYDTAYFTSQDLRFGNSDMFVRDVGARFNTAGADLDPDSDLDLGADDQKLTAHVKKMLPELKEPFVAVVQFANTHFPYWVEEKASPFQPSENTKDPEKNGWFYNFYRNSAYLQDRAIGELLRAIRASAVGDRTVIVFTSDHGEAFREHSQVGHTLSIYDEEIHVPAWIDAPDGTLTDSERKAIVDKRDTPVFHADLMPTFLDLIGIWDAPEIARFRARYVGGSLLRDRPPVAVPITNCAAVWGCPFHNWGMMRATKKLEAREWDYAWHCFDVADDPKETHDLGAAACGDLASKAEATFGGLPRLAHD